MSRPGLRATLRALKRRLETERATHEKAREIEGVLGEMPTELQPLGTAAMALFAAFGPVNARRACEQVLVRRLLDFTTPVSLEHLAEKHDGSDHDADASRALAAKGAHPEERGADDQADRDSA